MISRIAKMADVPGACCLLNEIIEIGGTTAYEVSLDESDFASEFLVGEHCISCYVCEDQSGDILGFQALSRNVNLPSRWVDIATFARAKPKTKGVGTLLFESTRAFAKSSGVKVINATIRADNLSGLSYYSKMGFVDYRTHKAIPLNDGTLLDRISKRYDVMQ